MLLLQPSPLLACPSPSSIRLLQTPAMLGSAPAAAGPAGWPAAPASRGVSRCFLLDGVSGALFELNLSGGVSSIA